MTVHDVDTPREPVVMTYHGVQVTDDYQWLEDASSERTRNWTEAQAARTEEYLSSLPDREPLRRRAQEILAVESTSYAHPRGAGGRYFALKHQPPKQQSFLVGLAALDDLGSERVLVDPNVIDPTGATTIDWYEPSPDGRLVAVSMSQNGTENGSLHLVDVALDQQVAETTDVYTFVLDQLGVSPRWS